MFITMLQVLFFYFHQAVQVYIQECGQFYCECMQRLFTIKQIKNCKKKSVDRVRDIDSTFLCATVYN